jgi:hypothetical protein
VTPREGWTRDWRQTIDTLSEIIIQRYRVDDPQALRRRLEPMLTKTVEVVALERPEGKKPVTFIRDQINALRSMSPAKALEALRHPHPVLCNYLDQVLEAQGAEIDQPADPDLGSEKRAAKRYALVMDLDHDVQTRPRRSTENPWATVAKWVADLLADVMGEEPKRSWDDYAQADTGWPLTFFRRFTELAVPSDEPPDLDKVWRNALDARKKLKKAI